jgi:hypothetical protein
LSNFLWTHRFCHFFRKALRILSPGLATIHSNVPNVLGWG